MNVPAAILTNTSPTQLSNVFDNIHPTPIPKGVNEPNKAEINTLVNKLNSDLNKGTPNAKAAKYLCEMMATPSATACFVSLELPKATPAKNECKPKPISNTMP